jgi:hypothetical protein
VSLVEPVEPVEPSNPSKRPSTFLDCFYPPATSASLLPLIDPGVCTVVGTWAVQQGEMWTDASADRSTVSIPLMPAGDYEITADYVAQGAFVRPAPGRHPPSRRLGRARDPDLGGLLLP